MIRSAFVTSAVIAVVLSPCSVGTAVAAGSSASIAGQDKQAAAAEAAPFLGDWTLTVQGPNGPGAFRDHMSNPVHAIDCSLGIWLR